MMLSRPNAIQKAKLAIAVAPMNCCASCSSCTAAAGDCSANMAPGTCGAPTRCGTTSKNGAAQRHGDLPNARPASPAAVDITANNHQICRASRSAVAASGISGGNPNAGASQKTMYPATPQVNPCRQSNWGLSFRRRLIEATIATITTMAKPMAVSTFDNNVYAVRSMPLAGAHPSAAAGWS